MLNYFNKLKNQKGFTLVELMVVVVIIGILVAIIIPIYNRVQDNAAKKAHEANLRTIDGAISMYIAQEGKEPTGIDDLEPYLPEVPTIPQRIVDNAENFLVDGNNALKEQNEDGDHIYYLGQSSLANEQMKAFPVLVKGEGDYRAGDTIVGE